MTRTFYTSDTHLGHALMARLRGYGDDITRHDADLVATWNSTVSPGDIVIHAGDVFLGGQQNLALVWLLNGRLILIGGNHDKVHPANRNWNLHLYRWMERFEYVTTAMNTRVSGIPVTISHFPRAGTRETHGANRYMEWRPPAGDTVLLHGHTHDKGVLSYHQDGSLIRNQLHIGWDAWGRPVEEDELGQVIAATLAGN